MNLSKLLAVGLIVLIPADVSPQAGPEPHPAMKLCNAGKFNDALVGVQTAVRTKEYKGDAKLWNCLGLALYQNDDDKAARKAFEQAVRLEPGYVTYRLNLAHLHLMNRKIDAAQSQLNEALRLEPMNSQALYLSSISDSWEGKFERALNTAETLISHYPQLSDGYILKSDLLIGRLGSIVEKTGNQAKAAEVLRESVSILTDGKAKVRGTSEAAKLETELSNKPIFADYLSRSPLTGSSAPVAPEPGVTPLKVTYKQKAQYTDRARTAGVQGTITVAALFGSNGKVLNVLLIKRLGYGLDEQAIAAARAIRFEPQQKDGKAVSVVRLVSYTFNIY
jgi:TonB family protein